MSYWSKYHLAKSIPDALEVMAASSGPARLIAGGSDLLLDLQQGRHPPVDTLVDVTEIPELCSLQVREHRLFIGAGLPLSQVVLSPLVLEHAQALYEAASLIGGPQVRNTATLGGNVAHALPAGDGTIALLALGAEAEIASLSGSRIVAVQELFAGPGKSTLDPSAELLVGFHLPLRQFGQGSAFQRVMRPQGVAIAILNMAAWIERDDEYISTARISIGPAGLTPFRARQAEHELSGKRMKPELISNAINALLGEARFRTSAHRATAEYRRKVAGVLLDAVVNKAWARTSQVS